MNQRRVTAVAVLLLASSCAANVERNTPSGSGGSARPDAASDSGYPGTGGSSASGSGGTSAGTGGSSFPSGSGGTTGSGGSASGTGGSSPSSDAGIGLPDAASPDAASDAPPVQSCAVSLFPISPPYLQDVPAGAIYRFRMGARLEGNALPAQPVWKWTITHEGNPVMPLPVDGEPATVEFATLLRGYYDVRAEVLGAMPPCTAGFKQLNAIEPDLRVSDFLIRVTPPAGLSLSVIERRDIHVKAKTDSIEPLKFQPLPELEVKALDEQGALVPAYFVQISTPESTLRFQGYVLKGQGAGTTGPQTPDRGFVARLDSNFHYNVVVVPDPAMGTLRAPILLSNLSPTPLSFAPFTVKPGEHVQGHVRTDAGPLERARVRLRNGLLPSTVGTVKADGSYELLARTGQFEARVVPPADSGLPEAQLPRSTGVLITDFGPAGDLDFTYAPISLVGLKLTVTRADGTPADKVNVVLEAKEGELRNVGTFAIPGRNAITVDGVMRVSGDTVAGQVSFERLPRARYRVVLVPPADLPGDHAITTIDTLDLTAAGAQLMRSAALVKRSRITVKLVARPMMNLDGLMVRAVDTAEDGIRRTVLVPLNTTTGLFELPSDPGRAYRLFVEPPANRSLPRINLDPVRAPANGTPLPLADKLLPEPRALTGTVTDGAKAVGGAVVQVFCYGAAPACVDREAPDISNTLPVDETISAADGSYKLLVPDPGQ